MLGTRARNAKKSAKEHDKELHRMQKEDLQSSDTSKGREDYRNRNFYDQAKYQQKAKEYAKDTNKARKQLAGGVAVAGAAGATGHAVAKNKQNKEASEMNLFERLEKTANESARYLEDGYLADKTLDSAVLGGTLGASAGGLYGSYKGLSSMDEAIEKGTEAAMNSNRPGLAAFVEGAKHQLVHAGKGAKTGAIAGGLGLGFLGAQKAIENKNEAMFENEEQLASEKLMSSLEKVASEVYPEQGRIQRSDLAEMLFGTGPTFSNYMKKNNMMGIKPEDSHTVANMKANAIEGGVAGALGGALGGAFSGYSGKRTPGGAAAGALIGTSIGAPVFAAANSMNGAVNGLINDAYDKRLRAKQEEQLASEDLMESLEKVAFKSLVSKAKDTLTTASGKHHRAAQGSVDNMFKDPKNHNLTVEQFQKAHGQRMKTVDIQRKERDAARGNVLKASAGTAAVAGVGAAAGYQAGKNEKTASEEFMTGLYKEAAAQILDMPLPETKTYVDTMDKITFSR